MLFGCVLVVSLAYSISFNLSPNDISILNEFYDATGGPYWSSDDNSCQLWDFDDDPNPCLSTWCGVHCSAAANTEGYLEIDQFYTFAFGLQGTIPDSFFNLSALTYIEFFDEPLLFGTLSECIHQLEKLQYLFITVTSMSGSLPSRLSELGNLSRVDLGYNSFSGNLDNVFNPLLQVELWELELEGNIFTGTIPASVITPTLERLSLGVNCFHGQLGSHMCNSKNLRELSIAASNQRCMDPFIKISPDYFPILNTMFTIPDIQSYLLRHIIEGPLPSCLLELPRMMDLELYSIGLTGTLPNDVNISKSLVS